MFKCSAWFLLIFLSIVSAKLPDFVKRCALNEPNLGECIKRNANDVLPKLYDGNKDLKIPPLVPLVIPHVESKGRHLKFSVDNITIYGLESLKLTNSVYQEKLGVMTMHGDHFDIEGVYDVDGRILILPIKGKGPFKLSFDDVTFTFTMNFEYQQEDGKAYLQLLNTTLEWEAGQSKYQLDNLFNGDPVLGKEMNKFLNENSKDVNKDVGYSLIEALKQMVDGALTALMAHPLDEIFPSSHH